jgi:hypothetical protein
MLKKALITLMAIAALGVTRRVFVFSAPRLRPSASCASHDAQVKTVMRDPMRKQEHEKDSLLITRPCRAQAERDCRFGTPSP